MPKSTAFKKIARREVTQLGCSVSQKVQGSSTGGMRTAQLSSVRSFLILNSGARLASIGVGVLQGLSHELDWVFDDIIDRYGPK
jgi:hypothetical protein